MSYPVQISENIFRLLEEAASKNSPNSSGNASQLFILPDAPLAGIRLSISAEEYFGRLEGLTDSLKPKTVDVLPTGDKRFPVIINAPVTVIDGKTFIDGREVVLIF